jgi:hypothetical protein
MRYTSALRLQTRYSIPEKTKFRTHSLKAVYEAAVWAVLELVHDIFETDEVPDIDGGLVLERVTICRRVEVDEMCSALGRAEVRHEAVAER